MRQFAVIKDASSDEIFAIAIKDEDNLTHCVGIHPAGRQWAKSYNQGLTKSLTDDLQPGIVTGDFAPLTSTMQAVIDEAMEGKSVRFPDRSRLIFCDSVDYRHTRIVPQVKDTGLRNLNMKDLHKGADYKGVTFRVDSARSSVLFKTRQGQYGYDIKGIGFISRKMDKKVLQEELTNTALGYGNVRRTVKDVAERKYIMLDGHDGYMPTNEQTFVAPVRTKANRLGRRIGGGGGGGVRKIGRSMQDPFDPNAWDGDGDGIVQEGTMWERPAIPGINTNLPGQPKTRTKPKDYPSDSQSNRKRITRATRKPRRDPNRYRPGERNVQRRRTERVAREQSGMRSRGNDPWDEGPSPAEENAFDAHTRRIDQMTVNELFDMEGLSNQSDRLLGQLIDEHDWDLEDDGADVDKPLTQLLKEAGGVKRSDTASKLFAELEDDFWDDPGKFMTGSRGGGSDPYDEWVDEGQFRGRGMRSGRSDMYYQPDEDPATERDIERGVERFKKDILNQTLNEVYEELGLDDLGPLFDDDRYENDDERERLTDQTLIRDLPEELRNEAQGILHDWAEDSPEQMLEYLDASANYPDPYDVARDREMEDRVPPGMRSLAAWRDPEKAQQIRDLHDRMTATHPMYLGEDIDAAVLDAIDIFDGRMPQYGNDAAYFLRQTATDFREGKGALRGFAEISDEDLDAAADLLDQAADAIEKNPIDFDEAFAGITGGGMRSMRDDYEPDPMELSKALKEDRLTREHTAHLTSDELIQLNETLNDILAAFEGSIYGADEDDPDFARIQKLKDSIEVALDAQDVVEIGNGMEIDDTIGTLLRVYDGVGEPWPEISDVISVLEMARDSRDGDWVSPTLDERGYMLSDEDRSVDGGMRSRRDNVIGMNPFLDPSRREREEREKRIKARLDRAWADVQAGRMTQEEYGKFSAELMNEVFGGRLRSRRGEEPSRRETPRRQELRRMSVNELRDDDSVPDEALQPLENTVSGFDKDDPIFDQPIEDIIDNGEYYGPDDLERLLDIADTPPRREPIVLPSGAIWDPGAAPGEASVGRVTPMAEEDGGFGRGMRSFREFSKRARKNAPYDSPEGRRRDREDRAEWERLVQFLMHESQRRHDIMARLHPDRSPEDIHDFYKVMSREEAIKELQRIGNNAYFGFGSTLQDLRKRAGEKSRADLEQRVADRVRDGKPLPRQYHVAELHTKEILEFDDLIAGINKRWEDATRSDAARSANRGIPDSLTDEMSMSDEIGIIHNLEWAMYDALDTIWKTNGSKEDRYHQAGKMQLGNRKRLDDTITLLQALHANRNDGDADLSHLISTLESVRNGDGPYEGRYRSQRFWDDFDSSPIPYRETGGMRSQGMRSQRDAGGLTPKQRADREKRLKKEFEGVSDRDLEEELGELESADMLAEDDPNTLQDIKDRFGSLKKMQDRLNKLWEESDRRDAEKEERDAEGDINPESYDDPAVADWVAARRGGMRSSRAEDNRYDRWRESGQGGPDDDDENYDEDGNLIEDEDYFEPPDDDYYDGDPDGGAPWDYTSDGPGTREPVYRGGMRSRRTGESGGPSDYGSDLPFDLVTGKPRRQQGETDAEWAIRNSEGRFATEMREILGMSGDTFQWGGSPRPGSEAFEEQKRSRGMRSRHAQRGENEDTSESYQWGGSPRPDSEEYGRRVEQVRRGGTRNRQRDAATDAAAMPRGRNGMRSRRDRKKANRRPGVDQASKRDGEIWANLTPEERKAVAEAAKVEMHRLMWGLAWNDIGVGRSRPKKKDVGDDAVPNLGNALIRYWFNEHIRPGLSEEAAKDYVFTDENIEQIRSVIDRAVSDGLMEPLAAESMEKLLNRFDSLRTYRNMATASEKDGDEAFAFLEHLSPSARDSLYKRAAGPDKDRLRGRTALGWNKDPSSLRGTFDEREGEIDRLSGTRRGRVGAWSREMSKRIMRPDPERQRRRELARQRRAGGSGGGFTREQRRRSAIERAMSKARRQARRLVRGKKDQKKVLAEADKNMGHKVVKVDADGNLTLGDIKQFSKALKAYRREKDALKVKVKKGSGEAHGEDIADAQNRDMAIMWEVHGMNGLPILVSESELMGLIDEGWTLMSRGHGRERSGADNAENWLTDELRFLPGSGGQAYGPGEYWSTQGEWGGFRSNTHENTTVAVIPPTARVIKQSDSNREASSNKRISDVFDLVGSAYAGDEIEHADPKELAAQLRAEFDKADSRNWETEVGKLWMRLLETMEAGDPDSINAMLMFKKISRANPNLIAPALGYDVIDAGSVQLVMNRSAMVTLDGTVNEGGFQKFNQVDREAKADRRER